jgi:hypothetical protein
MSIRIDNQVTNQLNVPIMLANNYINRPTAGIFGRLFISNDTYQIFQDRVSGWSLIADAGSGSSNLEQVTQNGNTTTIGIYVIGSGTLSVQSLTNGSVLFPAGGSGQISQDNANFFWDNTNKRLGLGTASPGQRLDVHSSTGVNAQFNGTGVTNATLQLQNAGTSKWTIGNYYNSGNNDFNIYDNVNTTYRAYFTNTGYAIFPSNVIIGSTNRSSSYGLDVYSSAYFRSSIYNLNYTQGSILFAGSGGLINQNNSQFFWDNTNNRLGIGTASPSYALDINGTIRVTGIATFSSSVNLGSIANSGDTSLLNIKQSSTSYNNGIYIERGGERNGYFMYIGGALDSLTFRRNYFGTQSDVMSLTRDGNVGIGTSSPNTILDVNGTINVRTNGFEFGRITTNNISANQGGLTFQFNQSGTFVEGFRLNASGNVLIGTTTDRSDRLQVQGDIVAQNTSGSGIFSRATSNSTTYGFVNTGVGNLILTNSGVANVGIFNMSTGIYTSTSDYNKKKDFEESRIGLNSILGLKPTLYRMKTENDTEKHLGFIAQEVKEFIPQAYLEQKDFIGLDFNPIVAVLVKAIQELNDKLVRNNIN